MKVLMLSDLYPPTIGGMQTHVQSLSKELSKKGHEVVVCTIGHEPSPNFEGEDLVKIKRLWGFFQRMPMLFKDPNIRYHPPLQDWLITKKLAMLVEKMKPDIIHAHGWITYSVLPLIGKNSVPVIATLHTYLFICPKRGGGICKQPLTNQCISCAKELYGTLKSLFVYYALKMNKPKLKKIDKFLAISLYQKNIYSKNLGLNNIILIPNAIDLKKFFPGACTKELIRRYEGELGIKSNWNKIIHISRLSRGKLNVILNLINATPRIVKEFPNTQILIVGDGEFFGYLSKLAEKINHQLGKALVILTGAMKEKDIPNIIDSADIVIGVGRVALEGMACGKPVIVAGGIVGPFGGNYGGIITANNTSELEVHNFTGRNSFKRMNPRKIAEDCIRLLADEEYRFFLGRFCREYVEKERDIRKIARQIETVYHNAIKAKKHSSKMTE